MVDLIIKKKNGFPLTKEEVQTIVKGFTSGEIPDYQMSALLMAICFQGLNEAETSYLTQAMVQSGETVDLSAIPGIKVDKHSTGGVGDKTTLVLAPLVAAAGIPVAKMSGRGLGHTGGTLDKLESIPGFRTNLTSEEFVRQVNEIGLAVCAQNEKLVPADKKLYALRDVTGTVQNISLIAASIMSKKLASGADAIVIDIKMGEGAFLKNREEAEKLASIMQSTALESGKKLVAVITDMNQPLGNEIGNTMEVREAMLTLQGNGPSDLTEVCLVLGSHMLVLSGKYNDLAETKSHLSGLLHSGKAYEKFLEFVKYQGGDVTFLQSDVFQHAPVCLEMIAENDAFIESVFALETGKASMYLGAGRETKESTIDYRAGITLLKKQGDWVNKGDVLARLYTSDEKLLPKAMEEIRKAFVFSDKKPAGQPLIIKTVL